MLVVPAAPARTETPPPARPRPRRPPRGRPPSGRAVPGWSGRAALGRLSRDPRLRPPADGAGRDRPEAARRVRSVPKGRGIALGLYGRDGPKAAASDEGTGRANRRRPSDQPAAPREISRRLETVAPRRDTSAATAPRARAGVAAGEEVDRGLAPLGPGVDRQVRLGDDDDARDPLRREPVEVDAEDVRPHRGDGVDERRLDDGGVVERRERGSGEVEEEVSPERAPRDRFTASPRPGPGRRRRPIASAAVAFSGLTFHIHASRR